LLTTERSFSTMRLSFCTLSLATQDVNQHQQGGKRNESIKRRDHHLSDR
jgi:hypothetical protein